MEFTFKARMWLYAEQGGWHFVTLPAREAAEIHAARAASAGPGGSVRVRAQVGEVRWRTSLFWDRARGSYLLPVKTAVRERAGAVAGDELEVTLRLDG